jgi:hypothetical protein
MTGNKSVWVGTPIIKRERERERERERHESCTKERARLGWPFFGRKKYLEIYDVS